MSELRERYRAQVRDEAKAAALEQLAAGGVGAVSVNAIGRALGVSGPALYRYFSNRDALLTELAVDAYRDVRAAVARAADLEAFARAFRGWALAQPHRYRLLFGPPLPGHDDVPEPVVTAAHELMHALVAVAGDGPEPPAPLHREIERWIADRPGEIPVAAALRGVVVWSRLHGFISLEIDGNFTSMGLDGDRLFAAVLADL